MASYRVLVVEDNHEVRRMVTASIKALDTEIDVLDVPSAEEALLISGSLTLDLVVLDIRLPGMSGLDMVDRLHKRRPETKIILVTGMEDARMREQVAQAEVSAYFFKPIEINAFLEAVKRCLWPEQKSVPAFISAQPPHGEKPAATTSQQPWEVPAALRDTGAATDAGVSQTPAPGVSKPLTARKPSQVSEASTLSGEPGASGKPGASRPLPAQKASQVTQAPPVGREAHVGGKAGASGPLPTKKTPEVEEKLDASVSPPVGTPQGTKMEPPVRVPTGEIREPFPRVEPAVSTESFITGDLWAGATPGSSTGPFVSGTQAATPRALQLTVGERLTALKMQLGAASVLLVDETGRVEDVAGNPSQVTTGFVVLPGIVQAISASAQVAQVMGKDTSESLQYFHTVKQCLYLTMVGSKHALLVVMSGYFDPDKLGLIDRAMHLASSDILAIQERSQEEVSIMPPDLSPEPVESSAEMPVDQEALDEIEAMFSSIPKAGDKQEADGFWETLEEDEAVDGTTKKDVLSYDQAREMGLFPDSIQQSDNDEQP